MKRDLEGGIERLFWGVSEVINEESLRERLRSGKKLRVKFGIDPTSPKIHLGHLVPLLKLRQLQEMGHKVILLIGDFTAMIGDPSDRETVRKQISETEVKANMKTYIKQVGKVLDMKKTEVAYNSKWLKKSLSDTLSILKEASLQQVLHRADIKKRMEAGNEISLLEILYPVFQGYDSVALKADIEIGATDQKFNLLMGRQLQKRQGQKEQDVIMMPLLLGLDGMKKMSKSFQNDIGVEEEPNEVFGKVMRIPDELMPSYFELLTDEIFDRGQSPRNEKLRLATLIVARLHDAKKAEKAREHFISVFSKKEVPGEIKEVQVRVSSLSIIEALLVCGVASRGEARRLILQKGVRVNQRVVESDKEEIGIGKEGVEVQVGKRGFFRLHS